jgi:enduracididine beta-hydroxylase
VTVLTPHLIELDDRSLDQIEELLAGAVDRLPGTAESPGFQRAAVVLAQELPRPLRSALYEFRLDEPSPVCLLRGFRVDDAKVGPTPANWRTGGCAERTRREEIFFYLCAVLLGEPVGWSTKQDGRLMHDIVPHAGDEAKQLGSGSSVPLTWHTEDGFSPVRADYLGLMCLRNPDRTGTTVGSLDAVELDQRHWDILWQDRFEVLPDGSHFQPISDSIRQQVGDELIALGQRRLTGHRDQPAAVPVLFGAQRSPYLLLDEYFARARKDDPEAAEAFAAICAQVGASLSSYPLEPGDICFLDNFRAVHGRDSFQPRFDGTDRWLKRLNLVRDLRKSAAYRSAPAARVLV